MNYSFFGTCANDHDQFFGCLITILKQSILPKQIILVDSGEVNIEKKIMQYLGLMDIKLIYIFKKVSRVKSLNLALDESTSEFSFRFDSRSRFYKHYAKNALRLLCDKKLNASVVGGAPRILPSSNQFEPVLCSDIMKRPYVFFYPNHRKTEYSGFTSSLYLGCFETNLLKTIRFKEKKIPLSEDSLIINDFLAKGFKAFVSSKIKISYICRESFTNILKLFNTYGYCRANTILLSKKLFISIRHFYAFLFFSSLILIIFYYSYLYVLFLPIILLFFNFIGELFFSKKDFKIYIPFYATLCQFSWLVGFLWSLLSIFKKKSLKSNFIS